MTTNNITNSTITINNYSATYHTHELNGSIPSKACNKCQQIKQLIDFYKDKSKYDGYLTQCKNCDNTRQKEYNKQNTDKIVKYHKEYYETNKDKIV